MPASAAVVVPARPRSADMRGENSLLNRLLRAREARAHEMAEGLAEYDRHIAACTLPAMTYGDQVCVAVLEQMNLTGAAASLNAVGLRAPTGDLFTSFGLFQWLQDPQGEAPNPALLELAKDFGVRDYEKARFTKQEEGRS